METQRRAHGRLRVEEQRVRGNPDSDGAGGSLGVSVRDGTSTLSPKEGVHEGEHEKPGERQVAGFTDVIVPTGCVLAVTARRARV